MQAWRLKFFNSLSAKAVVTSHHSTLRQGLPNPMGTSGSEFLLRNAQRGLRQPGLTHLSLSSEECRIINNHRTLERYCGISPSEMTGGPVR